MLNVPFVWPAGTVSDAGTTAAGSLLERLTSKPPAAAGLVRCTVPVDESPPTTSVGLSVSVATAGTGVAVGVRLGVGVRLAVGVRVAVRVTVGVGVTVQAAPAVFVASV